MKSIKYGKLMLLLIVVVMQSTFAVTFHVAKDGSGTHTTIQSAVDDVEPNMNYEIIIDDLGVYEEQVIIDSSKNGLVLRSKSITSASKPTIKYRDTKNIKPESEEESHSDATITFDRNGALIIMAAKNVRIEGIAIDGGKPFVFGSNGIWFNAVDMKTYPMQHGNGGISLWHAGDALIRYCDISNAFCGINIKDRNLGGVFANPNPSDIDSLENVPFAGFAEYGNHLIEHNRIHNNSFGLYSESAWDLGSVIRYNLFYENHHPSAAFSAEVSAQTSDGSNYPGGAILTKDQNLTPFAIYNNTFWHNLLIFVGIWKSGGQHLVFNNIIGPPYEYWSSNEDAGVSSNLEMEKCYVNREYNSVYAAQQSLSASYISVMNDFTQPKAEGDLITPKPFPASADVRYLETEFKSTSPTSPEFLEPEWSDANVEKYIKDKGWEPSGIIDPDGSRADLGAIPYSQVMVNDIVQIRPTVPVRVDDKTGMVTLEFSIIPRIGEISQPKIKMLRVVTDLDSSSKNWANQYTPIAASHIQTLTPPTTELKVGQNTIDVKIPSGGLGTFAFFEMTIEGLDSDGQPYTSSVGFIPYRDLPYYLEVKIMDPTTREILTQVRAGDPVIINVVAFKENGTKFTDSISPLVLGLGSTYELRTPDNSKLDTLRGVMPKGEGDIPAMFITVPIGSVDRVKAAGTYKKEIAFVGSSDPITILPGDPDTVIWQDPPSHMSKTAYSNIATSATAMVYDRFKNLITTPNKVNCVSLKPTIGDLVVGEAETDITGLVTFLSIVKNGTKGDTFPLVASLTQTGKTDTCYMIVGDARDRFVIFYGDTAAYDSTAKLEGCAGDRLPVVIRAIKTGSEVSTDKNSKFNLDAWPGISYYASDTSTTQIFGSQLVNGEIRIWVQGTGRNVANGTIRASSPEGDVDEGSRDNVIFKVCENLVKSAAYFADNGFGSVNRCEILYNEPLTTEEIPDSFRLSWPERGSSSSIMIQKSAVVQDPADAKHLTITIDPAFPPGITRKSPAASNELGLAYWYNTKTPEVDPDPKAFNISDGVGPLIESAILVQRFSEGNDTIHVTFTEPVTAEVVQGTTLYLIKKGTTDLIPVAVLNAIPEGSEGTRVMIVTHGDIVPEVEDSLKIIPTGTIVDAFNNHAHVDNRPMEITLQEVPAEISNAWYFDRNADGQIDVVRIAFKKKIYADSTVIKLKWEGTDQTGSVFTGDKITMLTTPDIPTDTIEITLEETTFSYGLLKNKTSGSMVVTATYTQFMYKDDNERSSMVNDMAAPVLLDSVIYYFGKIANGMKDADTLFVRYTETLQNPPRPIDSILVNAITMDGTAVKPYILKYSKYDGPAMDGYYRYIVDSTTAAGNNGLPTTADSAWISVTQGATNAVDNFGNAQLNPNNLKVRIAVKMPPIKLVFEAGPLPYKSGSGEGITIMLRNEEKADKSTTFDVSITIYDKVGNVVKRFPEEKGQLLPTAQGVVTVNWDGRNVKGRMVGTGTYLCCANGKYTPQNSSSRKLNVEDIKLGVLPNGY